MTHTTQCIYMLIYELSGGLAIYSEFKGGSLPKKFSQTFISPTPQGVYKGNIYMYHCNPLNEIFLKNNFSNQGG